MWFVIWNATGLVVYFGWSAGNSRLAVAPPLLDRVRDALEIALADVAAYRHALMLRSLRG